MQNTIIPENIVDENKNLIYSICYKHKNYCDIDDLYQAGLLGLIDAYKNFDPSKNVKFSTYAFNYILGEITKYIRENNNIKVSKDMLRLGKKINEYIDKFYEVKGYKPSIKDISLMLNIKESKVIEALDLCLKVKSLDEIITSDGKDVTLLDVTPDNNKLSCDVMLDLKDALMILSDEERGFIVDRFYNDLTQSEVAEKLGVNQVYVSRMEKRVLKKMKNKMVA